MIKHVIRNAFVPMAQYLPATILFTIAGSIYIESLYSIPGMGGLLVEVIKRQDNTLVQALVHYIFFHRNSRAIFRRYTYGYL